MTRYSPVNKRLYRQPKYCMQQKRGLTAVNTTGGIIFGLRVSGGFCHFLATPDPWQRVHTFRLCCRSAKVRKRLSSAASTYAAAPREPR